jgi:hypothetical protein
MHKLRLILIQFSRPFFPLNLVVSLYLLRLLLKFPASIIIVSQSVFAKMGVYGLILAYQWFMQNKSWYYYRNAGFSIKKLFIYSYLADMLLFLSAYSLLYFLHKL